MSSKSIVRTLRNKKLRAALYAAYDGKCAICGDPLPDDWHADHIVPWVVSQRTNLFEMQPLCPKCNQRKGTKYMREWEQALFSAGLQWPLKHEPYRGQREFLEKATKPHRPIEVVVLPTGYGKTILQIVYSAFAVRTKKVRHVILLVPRDNLRSSMVEEWHKHFPSLVPGAKVLNAVDALYALRRYAETTANLVIVASYQQINEVLVDFSRRFDCLVVADEAHHLYEEGAWARATASLEVKEKMYFTATPIRGDQRVLHDVPLDFAGRIDPLIQVTIKDAQNEGALCKVRAVAVQFWVDVETGDGVYRVTTDDLEAERIDFSTYEARRQLRYAEGFTTPLIEKMVLIHNRKHAQAPFKHQILVKAMSTHHADILCKQINAIVGNDDFAHAVHIHKSAEEIDYLLCRFRGVKRGPNGEEIAIPDDQRFPCLVQVDMAGEGYNNPYISTLVKADLTRGVPYVTQLIGRALRVNYELDIFPQTIDVLIPDDDQATMQLIEAEFLVESPPPPQRETKERAERDVVILDIPDVFVLEAGFIKLYELNGAGNTMDDVEVIDWADNQMPGWQQFLTISQIRAAYITAGSHKSHKPQEHGQISEAAKREKWRSASESAVGTLAGNVIRLITNQPLHHNGKELAGKLKTTIHTQWLRLGGTRTKEAIAEDFEKKHAWVKSLNDRVMNRDIPLWLREACRE